jgi:hypothetical protein
MGVKIARQEIRVTKLKFAFQKPADAQGGA